MARCPGSALAAAALALAFALPARADERKFTYSTEAKTLPKGNVEFEQWITLESGKESGTYHVWRLREELEYGVSDVFNISAYLNWESKDIQDVPGLDEEHDAKFAGASLEAKYKFADHATDPVGVLLYTELTFEQDEVELELKGVFSKSFGAFTLAYNFVFEVEWEGEIDPANGRRAWEHEFLIENTAGASLHLLQSFAVGVEGLMRTPFESDFERENTAYFVGPNAHVVFGGFWATLTVLFQVGSGGEASLNLEQFEKYEVRLIAGFNF